MSPNLGQSLDENLTAADHEWIENSDREVNRRLANAAYKKNHGHLHADTPHASDASDVELASPGGTTEGVQASSMASQGVLPSFRFRSTRTEDDLLTTKERNDLHKTKAKAIAKPTQRAASSLQKVPRQPRFTDAQVEWLITERLIAQKDFDGSASANSTLWSIIASAFKIKFKQLRAPKNMQNSWNIHVKRFRDYCQDCHAAASSGSSRDDQDVIVKPKYAELFELWGYNHRPLCTPQNIACDDDSGSDLAPEGEYEQSSPGLGDMDEEDDLSGDHEQPNETHENEEGSDPGFYPMRDAMEREERAKGKGPARTGDRDEDTGDVGHRKRIGGSVHKYRPKTKKIGRPSNADREGQLHKERMEEQRQRDIDMRTFWGAESDKAHAAQLASNKVLMEGLLGVANALAGKRD